ncbi:MAG: hypothetical protein H6810_05380 [Phycisphaeraceae bacterium]|nr:MAG: hypothetical protein H6810_05380 [Phycisphaeraceae bacterium]
MSSFKVKLVAISLIILSLVGSGVVSPMVAASAGRYKLTHTVRAVDSDPPEVSLGIAMGAFRGLFVNLLWMRANDMKEQGMFHEAIELAKTITRLQPRFPRVWAFHAWNLAYNVSVETQTPEERYQWVMAGVRLLRDQGIEANPNDLLLHKELAWIILHKLGGFTDDANQYYKREWAAEWTVVVGVPPRPEPGKLGREDVIEQYAAWLAPIDQAPATIEGVIEQVPETRQLLSELRTRVGIEPGMELLRRWTQHTELRTSPKRGVLEHEFGPKNRAFAELLDDPKYARAWAILIPHTRKRVLVDDYHMSPAKMIRYTRKFGPLDWRHTGAHGVYFAEQGIERTLTRFDEYNRKNFDFVNTDRMVMQAIQSLWRSGDIYFNYLDYSVDKAQAYFQAMPNPYFVQSYGDIYGDVVARGQVYEDPSRPRTNYAVGYENFLEDAIAFFYRRGQRDLAEQWYQKLRTWKGMNIHQEITRAKTWGTLDEFVQANLYDRYTSPEVATNQVVASLQGAFQALVQGDSDLFRKQFQFAADVHKYYFQQQGRDVVASEGAGGQRMEYMDRDFRFFAGGVFAATINVLPFDEVELAYSYAPDTLQKYAYDIIQQRFKEQVDRGVADGGQPFDKLFPEPEGMAAFRQFIAEKQRQLKESDVGSINQK